MLKNYYNDSYEIVKPSISSFLVGLFDLYSPETRTYEIGNPPISLIIVGLIDLYSQETKTYKLL